MLTNEHPSILLDLRQFRYGLMPVFLQPSGAGALVLKVPKEAILAARLNNEVKIYLLSDGMGPASHLGVVTAFFEDHDEPIVISTALFSDDQLLTDVVSVLIQAEFDLYFFDEHNREWMGVRATNPDVERCRHEFGNATFALFDMAAYADLANRLHHRFAVRDKDDDRFAFTLTLGERLYPDDFVIFDNRPEAHAFREARSRPAMSRLVREDPGPPHERDIAVLFSRAFAAKDIYLNPFREDTAKELTDILVTTEQVMLFVEAKDSPNTAASMNRSMERKRQAAQKQVEKAVKQLRGSLSYAKEHGGVTVQTAKGPSKMPLNSRQLLGLIVVREMFDHDQFANSKPVLDLVEQRQLPITLIDYAGLHMISLNLRTPERFIDALHNLFDAALEHGRFPRSLWSGPPPSE